ncbi:MAG: 2Fe-2S iron-sulfur cluster binding domain-containing protein [Planctomycetes bacterium]|nr:2Fe-2S iron-sulfur cluster binding domain-containing protein [Planctomycetota bacterium]
MAIVVVDGVEVEIGDGERLNGVQAARRAGIEIPHYCWHPGLSVVASCRMCLVESGKRDPATGQVTLLPKLVPACQTPATDGTVFVTQSDTVRQARAMVEEDLLIRHPIDCPICDKAGECSLQDYHFRYGRAERRADLRPFTSRRRTLGDTVSLFVDRCVMCSRCVRFCREVAGTSELMVAHRGAHEEIDVFPGFPLANRLSGNVVDLCPVGALADRDFLYQQRVWFMRSHKHVCAGCSTGCSIRIDTNQDRIHRLKPRANAAVNQWWMCDEGRYAFKHVHDASRIVEPRARVGNRWEARDWPSILDALRGRLADAPSITVVLSPHQTVEEAYLLAALARRHDPSARIVVGETPMRGADESFPTGFTIRAEKCPNRRGVERIAEGWNEAAGGSESSDDFGWSAFLAELDRGARPGAVWIAGGGPDGAVDPETALRLRRTPLLIVQSLFHNPLCDQADFVLPATAFAEREGSYVNATDRLQSFAWALRPPIGVEPDGPLYWKLLDRSGLYRGPVVLKEIAERWESFAAARGSIPETGLDLGGAVRPQSTRRPAAPVSTT